jgi:transposase-like protein
MADYPRSLLAFQRRFADEAACAAYLFAHRWPEGFRCPACRQERFWEHRAKAFTYECRACHRQTSITAGTLMEHSKLPLTTWFWAAYLMASHSNGISALQLQSQLGLGSYKSAWLLAAKLRRAMLAPDRSCLQGLVEVDETTLPLRTAKEPAMGGEGRSHQGKMLLAGAIEVQDGRPGRIRLAAIADFSAPSLQAFVAANIAADATAKTDGWSGYGGLEGPTHEPHVIGKMAAHVVLPWVHRVFANLKTWALGVYHGLRKPHLQSYLDEFVFRFNRRKTRHAAFETLTRLATSLKPKPYQMLIAREAEG